MNPRILFLTLAFAASAMGQGIRERLDVKHGEREGRKLTAELLSQFPACNYTNSGTLEIRQRGSGVVELPIRFTVLVRNDHWLSCYEALGSGAEDRVDQLTVVHQPGKPSRYYRGTPEGLNQAMPLSAEELVGLKFAGSDFWACDLGLEFLSWPGQRVLMKDMRSGQSCNVLESTTPHPLANGYARVVSWLDIDTGGVVFAESYNQDQKRVKEFAPKAFKKVDGEWQLEEMRMEDLTTRSRTTIFFDLETK
jgi:hypothetical protein